MKKILYTLILCALGFVTHAQISQAEYFIDADPGEGNGFAIPVGFSNNVDADFNVNTFGLDPGVHSLGVRVKGFDGHWSLYFLQSFTVSNVVEQPNTPVVAAEYFFDTDPGEGNGEPIIVTVGFDVANDLALNIGNLDEGEHQVFVRVRDFDGHWSLYRGGAFTIEQNTDNVKENILEDFSFFPNPAHDHITFPDNQAIKSVQLTDFQGKTIKRFNKSIATLDIASLDPGIYFLQVVKGNQVMVKKLVVD